MGGADTASRSFSASLPTTPPSVPLAGTAAGIYLTNKARKAIGLAEVTTVDSTPLTKSEIETSQQKANLGVSSDEIVKEWKDDLKNNPIGDFEFTGTPRPMRCSTSKRSQPRTRGGRTRRRSTATWMGSRLRRRQHRDGIRCEERRAHAACSAIELDAVLHEDFKGRKVRFIGDCVHGLLVEGTAQTTEVEETISNMTLCAAAMRSSFDIALQRLKDKGTDASSLGLAVGFEFGPMNVTRLGMKGELIRCSVSRGVIAAEKEQSRCNGTETAIGPIAYDEASDAVRTIFGDSRKRAKLDYDTAVNEMSDKGDKAARATKAMAATSLLQPASAAAAPLSFPNRQTGPAKPDGFA